MFQGHCCVDHLHLCNHSNRRHRQRSPHLRPFPEAAGSQVNVQNQSPLPLYLHYGSSGPDKLHAYSAYACLPISIWMPIFFYCCLQTVRLWATFLCIFFDVYSRRNCDRSIHKRLLPVRGKRHYQYEEGESVDGSGASGRRSGGRSQPGGFRGHRTDFGGDNLSTHQKQRNS